MKKRKITLIVLLIIILISIISLIILYINNNTKDKNNIYNVWNLYKQEVIKNNKTIYSFDASDLSLSFKENNTLDICYVENNEKKCLSTLYTYKNNIFDIEDNLSTLKGKYIMEMKNNTMILENNSNNNSVKIKFYFQGTNG